MCNKSDNIFSVKLTNNLKIMCAFVPGTKLEHSKARRKNKTFPFLSVSAVIPPKEGITFIRKIIRNKETLYFWISLF